MQTFLPHESFSESARCLDRARLGKQRVEGLQILKACVYRSAWGNHPAVLMWRGFERALHAYVRTVCFEWKERGYRDTVAEKVLQFCREEGILDEELTFPPWLGDERFHLSHRSNLIRKDADFYGRLWPGVPADLPYVWPVRKKES